MGAFGVEAMTMRPIFAPGTVDCARAMSAGRSSAPSEVPARTADSGVRVTVSGSTAFTARRNPRGNANSTPVTAQSISSANSQIPTER